MKKLTKLTALALALALVLGMTAFAGTPSEVVMTDDFSDANLNMSTFKTNRTAVPSITMSDESTATYFQSAKIVNTNPLVAGTKYYAAAGGFTLAQDETGKIVLKDTSGAGDYKKDTNVPQIGYTFPTAWTYNEDYALVAQIGHRVTYTTANGTNNRYAHIWGNISPIGAVYNQTVPSTDEAGNETTTTQTRIHGVAGVMYLKDKGTIQYIAGNQVQNKGVNMYGVISQESALNTENIVSVVIRPYDHSQTDENTVAVSDGSLNMIKLVNGYFAGNESNFHLTNYTSATGYYPITEVSTIYYSIPSYWSMGFSDFKLYKVSLNPADFTIEDNEITDVLVDDDFEIVFSQPVSLNATKGSTADCITGVVITDGDGNVVSEDNYTATIDQKVDGTAVKGVLKITPADAWDYDTTYTVTLPSSIKSIARIAMTSDNITPVTFTTVEETAFTMTLNAYKGLSATGTVTALEAGTTYFAVSATQSAGATMTNGTVKIEILDAEGNVVKYATANKTLSTTAANTFGAAFKLEAGQTAKAYVVGTKGVATK